MGRGLHLSTPGLPVQNPNYWRVLVLVRMMHCHLKADPNTEGTTIFILLGSAYGRLGVDKSGWGTRRLRLMLSQKDNRNGNNGSQMNANANWNANANPNANTTGCTAKCRLHLVYVNQYTLFENLWNAQIATHIYRIRKVIATIDSRGSPSNRPCPIFTGTHGGIVAHPALQY
jgi:hypothetical protein